MQKGLQAPGLFDLKAALLDSALKRIDGVAGIYEKSTSKEATTAAALMELGKIYRQLGQTEKAFQAFQKCLEITKERVKIKNYSDPSRQNLANTYFELAFCAEELNRDMKAALGYNQDGLKLYEDIYNKPKLDDFPLDRKVVRAGLAEAYTRVGVTQYRMGELSAALENYRKAYNLRRELAEEVKDNPQIRQDLSYSLMALAETSFRLGDRRLADEYYGQVLDQRESMAKLNPKNLQAIKELGDVYYMAGEFKLRSGDLPMARKNLESSREARQDLVDREGRNVLYRRDLSMALYRLGNLEEQEKHAEEATRDFQATLRIREELARISEGNDRRQIELMLAMAHAGQAARRHRAGRPPLRRPERRPRAAHLPRPLLRPDRQGHARRRRPRRSRRRSSSPSMPCGPRSARGSATASTWRPNPTSNRSRIATISRRPSPTSRPHSRLREALACPGRRRKAFSANRTSRPRRPPPPMRRWPSGCARDRSTNTSGRGTSSAKVGWCGSWSRGAARCRR